MNPITILNKTILTPGEKWSYDPTMPWSKPPKAAPGYGWRPVRFWPDGAITYEYSRIPSEPGLVLEGWYLGPSEEKNNA